MKNWVIFGVAAAAAVIGCAGGGTSESTTTATTAGDPFTLASARVVNLGQAMRLYLSDNDDQFPVANTWMDAIAPYVPGEIRNDDDFRSPAVLRPGYGFAFNAALAGVSATTVDPDTVMIFDSTVLTRNATASLDTRPVPGRYNGRNAEVAVDGNIPGPGPVTIAESVDRVRQNLQALQIYASDADDVLPPSGVWMDALFPYTRSERTFHSPIFDGTSQYGYAWNNILPGTVINQFPTPETTVNVFDSTATSRNAEASADTRPNPGRYGGQNAVGFLDGHVETRTP